jgi:hypothetical protein
MYLFNVSLADGYSYSFQRSGYEVYILEATYKDPAVCYLQWPLYCYNHHYICFHYM